MATKKKPTMATTSTKPSSIRPCRPLDARMIQNFHLVWLDESIDEENDNHCHNSIVKLRQVVNTVNRFTNADESIDYITDVEEGKTFMIVAQVFSQIIVPFVQDISQVNSIYIFCEDKTGHKEWVKENGPKCKVFIQILYLSAKYSNRPSEFAITMQSPSVFSRPLMELQKEISISSTPRSCIRRY
jgi:hypothetical protein